MAANASDRDDWWHDVFALYRDAVKLDPEQRLPFLKSAQCSDEVRAEVLELLNGLDRNEEGTEENDDAPDARTDLKLRSGWSRYTIVQPLGKGGTGEVFLARDIELDRTVALKFIDPKRFNGFSASQLMREARASSALNHPNIVTIHEIVESDSGLAIVMEFVEGSVLRSLIGAPMPVKELCRIGGQIALALAAAHRARIIHRDIKPENIIARPDGYVKLLDFGLARSIDSVDITLADLPTGTLPYMSPEQARGASVTPATDIFSLGIVLHELATGRHPFPGSSPFGIVDSILSAQPSLYESTGFSLLLGLRTLLLAMLDKKPDKRPSAQQVADRLASLAVQKSKPRARLISVLAAAFVFVAVFWYRPHRHGPPEPVTLKQSTTQIPENRVTAAAISADGKLLAFSTTDGIFVRESGSSATHSLPSPADFVVDKLRWMKDGTHLLAGGFSQVTQAPAVWSISLLREPARLFRMGARDPEPSPDGNRVAYTDSLRSVIWVCGANGEDAHKVYGPDGDERYSVLLWAPEGASLHFQRRKSTNPLAVALNGFWEGLMDQPMKEFHYVSIDLQTGKVLARMEHLSMNSGFGLPDGRIFYTGFGKKPTASGTELWELATDVKTGRPLSAPKLMPVEPGWLSDVTATADGHQAVVLRSFNFHVIYVGDYTPRGPAITNLRRFTLDASSSFPHSWSTDSKSLFFESNRGGTSDLFRQELGSRNAEALLASPANENLPILVPGQNWLLFRQGSQRQSEHARLMRLNLDGGYPEPVPIGGVPLDEFACALKASRCVLRETEGRNFFVFYELDLRRGKGAELARTKWTPSVFGDWTISPDGREIALPVHDSSETRIRVVALDRRDHNAQEIAVPGLSNLNGLNWTADGKGFLAVFVTSVGMQLTYIDRHARVVYLLDATYALPSPDGRSVALMIESVATNAWLARNL